MENASKALIIAGAILISILLIGLGVYVYTMAQQATEGVGLDSEKAQAQNSKFMAYFGDRVSAANVKSLMSAIRTNNITSETAEEQKTILVRYGDELSDSTKVSQLVKPGKTYWVGTENEKAFNETTDGPDSDAAYYKSGYLRVITVKENGAKGSTGGTGTGTGE